jgi:hypothetical protein
MASPASGISATQSGWQQLKLSAAERDANRAESEARSLRKRADQAQRDAQQAQENARTLQSEAGQAETTASVARRGVAAIKTSQTTESRPSLAYDRFAQVRTTGNQAGAVAAVVNSLGQVTGTLVSEAA